MTMPLIMQNATTGEVQSLTYGTLAVDQTAILDCDRDAALIQTMTTASTFNAAGVDFEETLVPAIVQDAQTKQVLTLAYMNAESFAQTLATHQTWFYSRSRQELWHKGATSGNYQTVISVSYQTQPAAILVQVEPMGPACHTGAVSCFFNQIGGNHDHTNAQ